MYEIRLEDLIICYRDNANQDEYPTFIHWVKAMKKFFTEEEFNRVETMEEKIHLIECVTDNSKIDIWYFEIMKKYDLFES